MLFTSAKFFVLLAATVLACSIVRPARRHVVLLAASYAFYGVWSMPYLLPSLLPAQRRDNFVAKRL